MYLTTITQFIAKSSVRHRHICPRQVLGVRIGLTGASYLGFDVPCKDKQLLVILETDGCFADGIEVVTGCTIGHRTMRVEDYGKIAATFVDVKRGEAVRVAPNLDVRQRAYYFAPGEKRHYFAQMIAYQNMPEEELLDIQPVRLRVPIDKIISRAGVLVKCSKCGEEIINEREISYDGTVQCRACAGEGYYSYYSLEGVLEAR